jgi:galacturan 1,4-alpha-galacturonidase
MDGLADHRSRTITPYCVQELQEAWKSACGAAGRATVLVPKGEFLSGPLNFSGPCKGDVTIQIDGTLLGTNDLPKYNGGSWINILKVNNLVITGSGTIDGQGANVYTKDPAEAKAFPNVREVNSYTNNNTLIDQQDTYTILSAWTDRCMVHVWFN